MTPHFLFFPLCTMSCVVNLIAAASSPESFDVSFPSSHDDLMLEGTLRLPSSDHFPVPAVVLIHGSGLISRDANLSGQLGMVYGFSIPIFAEIAEQLQDRGIAVLTYDKRSCGKFNGCSDNSYPLPLPEDMKRIDIFTQDALDAVEYLQGRDEVQPDSIVPVGHSQSGQFIPIMLQENPDIAGGVMLAGSYHPIDDLFDYQFNFVLDLVEKVYGMNETQAMETPDVAALAAMNEGVAAIRAGTSNEPIGGASAAFWRSWFELTDDAHSAAAVVDQPLLVLSGELDTNVPISETYAWDGYLASVGANYNVSVLDCVTHALNCLSQPNITKVVPADIGTEVDQKVHDALKDFVLTVASVDEEDDKGHNENDLDISSSISVKVWKGGTWAMMSYTILLLC